MRNKDDAANALRDMFRSRHYGGVVPVDDMLKALGGKQWIASFGKRNLKKAWKELVDEHYVKREGRNWVWQMPIDHPGGGWMAKQNERGQQVESLLSLKGELTEEEDSEGFSDFKEAYKEAAKMSKDGARDIRLVKMSGKWHVATGRGRQRRGLDKHGRCPYEK